MIKRVIILMVFLMSIFGTCYAEINDTEILNSFKTYIDNEVTDSYSTYNESYFKMHEIKDGWFKSHEDLNKDYKIDLQKTTSLISPYVGTLEIIKSTTYFETLPKQEDAKTTTKVHFVEKLKYNFTVAYQDGNWVVTQVKYYNPLYEDWVTCNAKGIKLNLQCYDK